MANDRADVDRQLIAWANAVNSGDSEGMMRLRSAATNSIYQCVQKMEGMLSVYAAMESTCSGANLPATGSS